MLRPLYPLYSILEDPFYITFLLILLFALWLLYLSAHKKVIAVGAKSIKCILILTLLYMFLPSILFIASLSLGGFVKSVTVIVLLYYLIKSLRTLVKNDVITKECEYELRLDLLLLALGILVMSYASLFWGRGFVHDWPKHRSVLLSLYHSPFSPNLYGFNILPHVLEKYPYISNASLTYYYAMYLPGVYATKCLALFIPVTNPRNLVWILSVSFFVWNMFGLILAFLLIPAALTRMFGVKMNRCWGHFYLVIILFIGLNYWYKLYNFYKILNIKNPYVGHAEWATPYFAQFSSFITLWQFVPHQLIVGLLAIVVIFLYRKIIGKLPICLISTFLITGSVFCWVGMLPIALFFLVDWLLSDRVKGAIKRLGLFLQYAGIQLVATLCIALIVLLFYSGAYYQTPITISNYLLMDSGLWYYSLFLLIELVPMAVILCLCFYKKFSIPFIVWFSIAILILLPILKSEFNNDLIMRASIPALCTVMIFCAFVIQKTFFDSSLAVRILLGLFFAMVIIPFINEFSMGLVNRSEIAESGGKISRQYAGNGEVWKNLENIKP